MDTSQIMAPSCAVELIEANVTSPIMDFICTYSPEYYGINATLTMVAGQSEIIGTCTNSIETGSIKMENVSFSSFLENWTDIAGNCSLQVPNIQHHPACNFTIVYITPRIWNMNVGDSVNLTCNHKSESLKWWALVLKENLLWMYRKFRRWQYSSQLMRNIQMDWLSCVDSNQMTKVS